MFELLDNFGFSYCIPACCVWIMILWYHVTSLVTVLEEWYGAPTLRHLSPCLRGDAVHPPYVTCHCGFHELFSFFLNCWSCKRTFLKHRLFVLPSDMLVHRVHMFAYPISSRSALFVDFPRSNSNAAHIFQMMSSHFSRISSSWPSGTIVIKMVHSTTSVSSAPFSDIFHSHLTLATYINFRRISVRKCILTIKNKSHYQTLHWINFPTSHSCTLTLCHLLHIIPIAYWKIKY